MILKNKLLVFLDKKYPPEHSFIDGMLLDLISNKFSRVIFILDCNNKKKVFRYKNNSICIKRPFNRKSIFYIFNFIFYLLIFFNFNKKYKKNLNVFVRNDPFPLLVSFFVKKNYNQLIYQNSFPHELIINKIKKYIYLILLKFFQKKIDTIIGVSEESILRLKKIFNKNKHYMYIPLLPDSLFLNNKCKTKLSKKYIRFIYIGTHHKKRELDYIYKHFNILIEKEINFKIYSIGGDEKDINYLKSSLKLQKINLNKKIVYIKKINRFKLPNLIQLCDVGISIIPNNKLYNESSPTKFVEYLASGLAVLASTNVKYQKQILELSKAGIEVKYDSKSITKGIKEIIDNPDKIYQMKINAESYVKKQLTYNLYLDEFIKRCLNQ